MTAMSLLRVLAHAERADGLQPRDQDDEVDDQGQDGPLDEEIGEFHGFASVVFRLGRGLVRGLGLVVHAHGGARCAA